MVLEVSVHDHLAPLYLGLWNGRHIWQNNMAEESGSPPGSQEAESDREKGVGEKI
jgi:hypothetical protein